MSPDVLAACTSARIDRAEAFSVLLPAAMTEFQVDTPARQAMFLAQVGHESGGLRWLVELWGPTDAQRRYEGRRDLGNTTAGDGYRFRGRGLIQLTGRANYMRCGLALGIDLMSSPQSLGQPTAASRSAGWFWRAHGCNELADAGDFEAVTRRINGGLNGYPTRMAIWADAKVALGIVPTT